MMKRIAAIFGLAFIPFCCSAVLGLALIDQNCLWDSLRFVSDLLRLLGYVIVGCN
jgi:hypothetical protein